LHSVFFEELNTASIVQAFEIVKQVHNAGAHERVGIYCGKPHNAYGLVAPQVSHTVQVHSAEG
jgi:hypothetical protein